MDLSWTLPELGAGLHHALLCHDESQREEWLDRICQQLQQQSIRYGLLHQQGALISNLSALDNVLLPSAWQRQLSPTLLQENMCQWFRALGYPDEQAIAWLRKRPNQLTSEQLRAAIIVRALLAAPTVLLCDELWFVEQNRAELALLQRAEALWPRCCWLLVYADAVPILPERYWQQHELPSLMETVTS
jgi:ABC-type nitrate/sulfonate/bicarbonate transport system ATPase subunit